MAKELIATIASTYEVIDKNPDETIIAVVTPVTPSIKNKAGGSFIWHNNSTFTVIVTAPDSGATIPSAPASGVWNGTAQKTKEMSVNEVACIVDDESDTINATPKIPGNPPIDYPVSFKLKIIDTGQTKVSTE